MELNSVGFTVHLMGAQMTWDEKPSSLWVFQVPHPEPGTGTMCLPQEAALAPVHAPKRKPWETHRALHLAALPSEASSPGTQCGM
jgi:hypothetical protein